jgi:[acyl-carrier-protein] S-malonyltransferase
LRAIQVAVKEAKGKVIVLNVAGAFHSRLMKEAEASFAVYMVKVDFKDLKIPLINNVDARVVTQNEDIKQSLVRQMSSSVLWWPSMQQFEDCDVIIEIGPGTKLSKMLKREWPDKQIVSVNTPADIEQLHLVLGRPYEKTEQDIAIEQELMEKTNKPVADTRVADTSVADTSVVEPKAHE